MTKRSLKKLLAGLIGGVLIALAISMFTAATASVNLYYSVTDLGNLGGGYSTAYGINYAGQVVGNSSTSSGKQHAFFWENGMMTDLGTLGGDTSGALDINSKGQVSGYAYNRRGERHGFLWSNGIMADLGSLGGDDIIAYGINDMGQIIGYSSTSAGTLRGFLWKNRIMTDIGSLNDQLDDTTQAIDINNEGQVVGSSDSQDGPYHAFRWSEGTMTDLGTLGGNFSQAYAINKAGDVVGWAQFTKSSTAWHAFLWSNANGTMTDLGTLTGGINEESIATDINNAGRVIGYTLTNETNPRYFTWYKGTMTDLNTLLPENSGWKITGVYGINNHGQIVGQGSFNGGKTTAVLLTPVRVTN